MADTVADTVLVIPEDKFTFDSALATFGTKAINIMLYLAGAIAVGFLLVNAIKLMTSGGDETKVESAKKGITYSIMGVIVISLSLVIVGLIKRLITG